MIEFVSPFDTIFVTNTRARFEEGDPVCDLEILLSSDKVSPKIQSDQLMLDDIYMYINF